jgi:hypothetical protein
MKYLHNIQETINYFNEAVELFNNNGYDEYDKEAVKIEINLAEVRRTFNA